jgi:glyoxylase-like metal-dependent hydrolase (beta-lactamase superfamily II)
VAVIQFVARIDDVPYGDVVQVSPLIRRVIAENPSKYTYRGTGTYIVGNGDVAVIDPGPILDSHRQALERALVGSRVVAIVITHCHSDHSPLAKWLHETTGAPTYGVGPHAASAPGDDDDDDELVDDSPTAGAPVEIREDLDRDFVPTRIVRDGDVIIDTGEFTLVAVATPGHTSNHMCVSLPQERALFSGDHVMGWSTTVISPPDGDMRSYIDSLKKLQLRDDAVIWPTHGGPITDPQTFLAQYLAHRLEREEQIVGCLRDGMSTIAEIVAQLYKEVPETLHKAAGRSVLSHLIKLIEDGRVVADGSKPRRKEVFALA